MVHTKYIVTFKFIKNYNVKVLFFNYYNFLVGQIKIKIKKSFLLKLNFLYLLFLSELIRLHMPWFPISANIFKYDISVIKYKYYSIAKYVLKKVIQIKMLI